MADIFISHSGQDNEAAAALGERIRRERPTWSLFYDKDNIRAGQRWQERLREELQSCRVVLVLLSRNWLGSAFLFVEGNQTGIGADIGWDREPVVGVEPRTVEGFQDLLPRPVLAVAQADTLALVQDRWSAVEILGSQILGLDADHVLAAEGGGHCLGEAPGPCALPASTAP